MSAILCGDYAPLNDIAKKNYQVNEQVYPYKLKKLKTLDATHNSQ